MAQDDPYNKQAFVGRSAVVRTIEAQLLSADANRERQRSLIVEGPAGRGKSWLLGHIYQRFQPAASDEQIHQGVVACLFKAGQDLSVELGNDSRWHPIIARIFLALYRRLAKPPSGGLFDLIGPATDDLAFARLLDPYPATAIFPQIVRLAEENSLTVVLIVDSLEEIEEATCADFESYVLVPLMRSEQVRLLTARRVDSHSHNWRKYQVRNQTKQLALPSLDEEPAASEPPVIQQLERLIISQQQKTRQGSPTDMVFVQQQRASLLQQAQNRYRWGNPGLNACLTGEATDGFAPPRLTASAVESCLRERLRGPRTIVISSFDEPTSREALSVLRKQHGDRLLANAPQSEATTIEQLVFSAMDALVRQFGDTLVVGVLRTEFAPVLGMEIGRTVEFLAYLQELGIGLLERDGSFKAHPEFVQLFAWLQR